MPFQSVVGIFTSIHQKKHPKLFLLCLLSITHKRMSWLFYFFFFFVAKIFAICSITHNELWIKNRRRFFVFFSYSFCASHFEVIADNKLQITANDNNNNDKRIKQHAKLCASNLLVCYSHRRRRMRNIIKINALCR